MFLCVSKCQVSFWQLNGCANFVHLRKFAQPKSIVDLEVNDDNSHPLYYPSNKSGSRFLSLRVDGGFIDQPYSLRLTWRT